MDMETFTRDMMNAKAALDAWRNADAEPADIRERLRRDAAEAARRAVAFMQADVELWTGRVAATTEELGAVRDCLARVERLGRKADAALGIERGHIMPVPRPELLEAMGTMQEMEAEMRARERELLAMLAMEQGAADLAVRLRDEALRFFHVPSSAPRADT